MDKIYFALQNITGHSTTNDQLEKMLEQNNPAVFTLEVNHLILILKLDVRFAITLLAILFGFQRLKPSISLYAI